LSGIAGNWLTHPRLRNAELGSAEWFEAQQALIYEKPLIRRCYDLWYRRLLADSASVPGSGGALVELGSGSGYIKRLRPDAITSDVMPGVVDLVLDGRRLPFRTGSVRALVLAHVFHHIPDVEAFLAEANRVLMPGGVIAVIDVPHTRFARWFFSRVHPEPYNETAAEWQFPEGHSILDSNQALTWMVFERDRDRFERLFPELKLECREYLPWLSYLLSGGVNLRSFVPGFAAPLFIALDWLLKPLDGLFAVHWHLRVRKDVRG
jgi:SAM-dependent methyltransferase